MILLGHGVEGNLGGFGVHIAAEAVEFDPLGKPVHEVQVFRQFSRCLGTAALLQQHMNCLLRLDPANFVGFSPFQDADGLQGYLGIGPQPVLAHPGISPGDHIFPGNLQKGLVVIDHNRPIPQHFPPEPGVGGLARAAFGGEKVGCTVHSNDGAVEKNGVEIQEDFRDFAQQGQGLQIGVGVLSGREPLDFVLLRGLKPFKIDVFLVQNQVHFGGQVAYVVFAEGLGGGLPTGDAEYLPTQPGNKMVHRFGPIYRNS